MPGKDRGIEQLPAGRQGKGMLGGLVRAIGLDHAGNIDQIIQHIAFVDPVAFPFLSDYEYVFNERLVLTGKNGVDRGIVS